MSWDGRPVGAAGVVSSVIAPLALVGGFAVAAATYPGGFDSGRGTISALAALGSPVRGLMTAALLVTGVCHIVTASSLRALRPASRVILAVGGAATIAVAVFPLDAAGRSAAHAVAATVAFLAMSLWPGWIRARVGALPRLLRPSVTRSVAAVLTALALLFFALVAAGSTTLPVGAVERVLAGAQAVVPLLVVLALLASTDPA